MGGRQSSGSIEENGKHGSNNSSSSSVQNSIALDDFLVCQLCNEEFNLTTKIGKFLDCHHTFCLVCLRENQHYSLSKLQMSVFSFCLSITLARRLSVHINAGSVPTSREEQ